MKLTSVAGHAAGPDAEKLTNTGPGGVVGNVLGGGFGLAVGLGGLTVGGLVVGAAVAPVVADVAADETGTDVVVSEMTVDVVELNDDVDVEVVEVEVVDETAAVLSLALMLVEHEVISARPQIKPKTVRRCGAGAGVISAS
ncbi:MAG: hypothetical protein ABIQ39_16725 [Ilumatobacteraceae bacterium]